jgi:hypothetical protein
MFEVTANPVNNLNVNWAFSQQKMHDAGDFSYRGMNIGTELFRIVPRTNISFDVDYLNEKLINRVIYKIRPEATYYLTDRISVSGMFEYEKRTVNVGDEDNEVTYTDYILEVGSSWASKLNGTVYYEKTNEEPDEYALLKKKQFVFYEINYFLSNEHKVTVGYGSLRGGEVCSGGVCKYEIPFEGLRVTLTSVF